MRWKAFFYLDKIEKSESCQDVQNTKPDQKYGFRSRRYPKQIKDLIEFKKDLFGLFNKIQFRQVRDTFQSKMKADIKKVNSSPNIFAFADKTSNVYEIFKGNYEKTSHVQHHENM